MALKEHGPPTDRSRGGKLFLDKAAEGAEPFTYVVEEPPRVAWIVEAPSRPDAHLVEAAILRARARRLTIEPLKMEGPRDDEVLVRIVASGICRTDVDFLHTWDGAPVVLGHEGAGVVEQTGRRVQGFHEGDHVLLSYQSCGDCDECRRGRPARCRYFNELNFGFGRLDGSNGLEGSGVRGHFFGQSSFATHSLATTRNLVRISPQADLHLLAPLGCGLQTGAGTVMNSLGARQGASIAVLGTGTVGLAAVMAARIVGANPIIGIDIRPGRLELALQLGATHVINPRLERIPSAISRIARHGLDYVVEITGDRKMYAIALQVVKPKGRVALVADPGTGSGGSDPRVIGIIQGDAVPQRLIPHLIELYHEGLFPFDRLVTFYDFRDINRAIDDFEKGRVIKPVLRMAAARARS